MAKKIMIVDDDVSIVRYLQEVFHEHGYATCTAPDGADAVEVFLQEKPDLVTLDIEMPKQWGPRFYRELTRGGEHKEVPVIVITGLQGGQYAIGKAAGHLRKPVDVNKLMELVHKAIEAAA